MGITHIYLAVQTLTIGLIVLLYMKGIISFTSVLFIVGVVFSIYILYGWCEYTGKSLIENIQDLFKKKK